MGLNVAVSGHNDYPTQVIKSTPIPVDHTSYEVLRNCFSTHGNTVLLLKYRDYTNFGGKKIVVLSGSCYGDPKKYFPFLDPHFYLDSPIIARFKPTEHWFKFAVRNM